MNRLGAATAQADRTGVEDGPADLGPPRGLVVGVEPAHEIALPDGPVDTEGAVGDIGRQCSVGAVDVGVGPGVHNGRQLDRGQGQRFDAADRPDLLRQGDEDGDVAPFFGEEVVGDHGARWAGRRDALGGQTSR